MKKFFVLLLCIAVVSLAACGEQTSYVIGETAESFSLAEGYTTEEIKKHYEKEIPLEDAPEELRNFYEKCISREEFELVAAALEAAPTEKLCSAQAYLLTLLRGLENVDIDDIEITFAEVIPFPLKEKSQSDEALFRDAIIGMEERYGCDEYAVRINDPEGNEYILWNSYTYEKMFRNGVEILSYYHVIF